MEQDKCRVCGSLNLRETVNLGLQPWGNDFRDLDDGAFAEHYPLVMMFCNNCALSQLNFTVPKEKMFLDHTYVSGSTETLRRHFFENAKEALDILGTQSDSDQVAVLDIGSNDGTQLEQFQKLGCRVLGVESAQNIAQYAKDKGIPTDVEFFNEGYSRTKKEKFDIISASGVFFHLEELHSATKAVKSLLKDDGIFVVQFIYLKEMVDNLAFDQIYHEHLVYYLFSTLEHLLKMHGLEIFHAKTKPIHGGSGIAYVCHEGARQKDASVDKFFEDERIDGFLDVGRYDRFMADICVFKRQTIDFLKTCKSENKAVFGLGAPVKGNTLLNFFEIDQTMVECLVEINDLRENKRAPGSNIPVVLEDSLARTPDVYFVLAWNFKNEILRRYKDLIDQGIEFYFPIDTTR